MFAPDTIKNFMDLEGFRSVSFVSGELDEKSVSSILELTAPDGKKYKTGTYSLDMIISVGYRVNSGKATQFRVWATKVLRNHMEMGYTVNERRLKEKSSALRELNAVVRLISKASSINVITKAIG